MGKFHSFATPEENPVLSALDPSACYLIQFMSEDGKFGVQLVYYDSTLELYCAICFVTPAAMDKKTTGNASTDFGEEGFLRTAGWIDAMLDSFFTEHVPLAISGIPALNFDPTLRSRLLRHLTDRCSKNGLPLVILP